MSVQHPPVTEPAPGFSVAVRPARDRVVVALSGELDIATVERAEGWVRALYERGFTQVAVDLRDLTFIDSSGLRLLLRLDRLAGDDGCSFELVDGEGPARRLLQLTGLTGHFSYVPPVGD